MQIGLCLYQIRVSAELVNSILREIADKVLAAYLL